MQSYVYIITNLINGKFYVGKSNSPKSRWNDHKKIALGGKDKYPTEYFAIHAALNKYGINNFKFETIEQFSTEDEAYYFEMWWVEFLESNKKNNGYNCNSGGRGGIKPTEETRAKLIIAQNKPEKIALTSKLMKQRHQDNPGFLGRINIGNQYTKGRKLSDKEKDHLSDIFTGRLVSDITKNKISLAQSGENHSQSKVTESDVINIRCLFKQLTSGKKNFMIEKGKMYNVNPKTIENIVYRISWKHL